MAGFLDGWVAVHSGGPIDPRRPPQQFFATIHWVGLRLFSPLSSRESALRMPDSALLETPGSLRWQAPGIM
jgi:hypothetical protein